MDYKGLYQDLLAMDIHATADIITAMIFKRADSHVALQRECVRFRLELIERGLVT